MSNSKIHKVARKHATNFKQGYRSTQNDIKPFWLFAAVFLAIIWIIIGALGVRIQ